jgi:hypothetical protein
MYIEDGYDQTMSVTNSTRADAVTYVIGLYNKTAAWRSSRSF